MSYSIGFACTTINAEAEPLQHNLNIWTSNNLGPIAVSLDRKSKYPFDLLSHYIKFDRSPASTYERLCPWDSYSRKNIAFLELIHNSCDFIYETDDDNKIYDNFDFLDACRLINTTVSTNVSANIFTDLYPNLEFNIWARGYPIRCLDFNQPTLLCNTNLSIGVIQTLVDGNPDVDALIRLVQGSNLDIQVDESILPLTVNTYHPFNSQSTLWPASYFPLMYLPSTCSFRMTDIWRGYVAQRVLSVYGSGVAFIQPAVHQQRNAHIISSDFFAEHSGYIESEKVISTLHRTELIDSDSVSTNLVKSYVRLVEAGLLQPKELTLLQAWLDSVND